MILRLMRFGDPILRRIAPHLTIDDIRSEDIQELIANIRQTNKEKQYGVGLAAPQVGISVALSVIGIKPTPTRPENTPFEAVIINPEYTGLGRRTGMWEGCQSCGRGNETLYAKALRFRKIRAEWLDEQAHKHEQVLEGFPAHVFQHETDHLNGILFVDRVRDTKTYMMADEFRKRMIKQ